MNLKTVTIADLKPHPDNPNTHPAKQVDALVDSLNKFDQVKNVVIWNNRIIAGHGVVEAAKKAGLLTLEAQDISHWDEAKATEFMLADIRLPDMGVYDEAAMAEALRHIDEPLDIPGFDEDFLARIGLEEDGPKKEPEPPPIDKAEELQEKWQCETGQIWQIESKANPGMFHRLICGDCRNMAMVEALTEGKLVNGVFTSPPYAMQRAKQYGGVEVDEYVDWWEAVQENMRAVLIEDGSFFVNIKPHCKDGQRVLYVFDLVTAMVRRWGWRFVDELCWVRHGVPKSITERFRNAYEPVFHFAMNDIIKMRADNVKTAPSDATLKRLDFAVKSGEVNREREYSKGGFSRDWSTTLSMKDGVYPDNVIRSAAEVNPAISHAAAFPLTLNSQHFSSAPIPIKPILGLTLSLVRVLSGAPPKMKAAYP